MKDRKNERGFTLVELLIVMIILGLLAALVAPRMFGKVGKSKQKAAQSQIALFETAIDTYRLGMGKFPGADQGLMALRVKSEADANWDGPYLPKEIPLDPWGHPYEYRYPGEHGDYDILSYGADGQPGGDGEDADVVNWKSVE
jgi:general secretion pathway protein G